MGKIRLELDALSVESFSTAPDKGDRDGTVFGHLPPDTYAVYCSDGRTCYMDTCEACGTAATDCGTCATACGTCATDCGTCATACGTCDTYCGTCDPYCCCTCSCY
jgi:hypothetical protein